MVSSPLRIRLLHRTPSARVQLAASLLTNGHTARANRELYRALSDNPELAPAHVLLAVMHLKNSEEESAMSCLKLAIRIDPNYALAWGGYGSLLHRQGEHLTGLQAIDKAIALSDEEGAGTTSLHILRGTLLENLGREDEAAVAFRLAVAADCGSARALTAMAEHLTKHDGLSEARALAGQALQIKRWWGPSRILLGDIEASAGSVGDALQHYVLSVGFSPEGLQRAADLLLTRSCAEEALLMFRIAILCHPGHLPAYFGAARIYMQLDRKLQAASLCRAALRREPDNREGLALLAEVQVA